MIDINLLPNNSSQSLDNVGGFNLSLVNVKMLVLSIVALYGVEIFVSGHFESELSDLTKKEQTILSEQRKVSGKLRNLAQVKKKVEDLNKQEVVLAKKIDVIKKIVDKRQNPFKVLKYIAENTPKDIWLNEIEFKDNKLKILGNSKSWKSIGAFLENLKTSIFFSANISYEEPEGVEKLYKGQRVEVFKIEADIVRFQ